MTEPLELQEALDALRATVKEAGSYVDGSPAQAAYLRTMLVDVCNEVMRAVDARHPDPWNLSNKPHSE